MTLNPEAPPSQHSISYGNLSSTSHNSIAVTDPSDVRQHSTGPTLHVLRGNPPGEAGRSTRGPVAEGDTPHPGAVLHHHQPGVPGGARLQTCTCWEHARLRAETQTECPKGEHRLPLPLTPASLEWRSIELGCVVP